VPPTLITISDLSDPRVAPYLNLKDRDLQRLALAPGSDTGGLFICEAELTVRQLLGSRFQPVSMLLTPARAESLADLIATLPDGVPVLLAAPDIMNAIAGFDIHRGVLAAARRAPMPPLDQLLSRDVLLVGEGLSNHDNVGGLFRTVAGVAGTERAAIVLDPKACDPLYRKSVRVSIGQALKLPFTVAHRWPEDLAAIRAAGFTLVAMTPGPSAIDLREVSVPKKLALMVGAEGPGLSDQALAAADVRAKIDMAPGVDSLNVVVAAGIALHALLPR
jgi:tRNA G18 (ribose-2'-O)-methylase SpoU